MTVDGWAMVAPAFHKRVREVCWDGLARDLADLHRPHLHAGLPVCTGCDRERAEDGDGDPVWPCRTYTLIAATVLAVPDVEAMLTAMLQSLPGAGTSTNAWFSC